MLSLKFSLALFGAAASLPQSTIPPAVAACYTLPIDFAVHAPSLYRPCSCIRDHNALVTPFGLDEPCLVSLKDRTVLIVPSLMLCSLYVQRRRWLQT
jgi:hypothetical protein